MRITEADRELLLRVHRSPWDRIAEGDVTWEADAAGRTSYKLWSSSGEYEIVTRRIKRLVEAGLVTRASGYRYNGGMMTLTEAGRRVIGRVVDAPSQ